MAGHGPDAPPILTITVDVPGRRLGIVGELDLNGQRALADAVSILTEVYAPADIVIDLSGIVFIDICGLNALEDLRRAQHLVGASLFLVGVPAIVTDLYDVAGLAVEHLDTPSGDRDDRASRVCDGLSGPLRGTRGSTRTVRRTEGRRLEATGSTSMKAENDPSETPFVVVRTTETIDHPLVNRWLSRETSRCAAGTS